MTVTADGVAAIAAIVAAVVALVALYHSKRSADAAEKSAVATDKSAEAAVESASAATSSAASAASSATEAKRSADAGERSADAAELQVATSNAQLGEARRTREQQVRPYVAVLVEQDPQDPQLIYFVVRNFGVSPARDVAFEMEPEPQSSDGPLRLPSELPYLPPGGEFRTFWDSGLERRGMGLPERHRIKLSYRSDEFGPHADEHILDLAYLKYTLWPSRD